MRIVALLSDGIDSPVALYLALRHEGVEGEVLNFIPGDAHENYANKIKACVKHVQSLVGKKIPINFAKQKIIANILEEIKERHERYRCILCKRFMYRSAQLIALRGHAKAIVTGENIGQVASQTVANLAVIESAITLPVVRPLLGMNKEEIIDISRKLGLFEISSKNMWKCSIAPKRPILKARLSIVRDIENTISVDSIIEDVVKSIKVVSV